MDTPLFDGELVHARRMIYTPSAFAKSNLVHLQEVGQLQARSPHASTRQGLASYLFFVVESGSGTLEYEGETRVLSAGDCVFLDCRRPYRHYTGDDLWQPSTKNTVSAAASRAFAPRMQPPMPRCWKPCIRWQIPTIMCATCRYAKSCWPC